MRIADTGFFVGQALTAVRNSATINLMSVLSIALALLVVAMVTCGWANLELLAAAVRAEAEVVAYVSDDAAPADVDRIIDHLGTLSGVHSVRLVDAGEARARMLDLFGDAFGLEAFGEFNPFAQYVEIGVRPDVAYRVAAAAGTLPGVEAVRDNREIVERIAGLSRFTRIVGLLFGVAVLFMSGMVVSQIVRLSIHARRQEIATLRLLGASEWFVRVPFVLEGMVVSGSGGLVAALVIGLLYSTVYTILVAALPFVPLIAWQELGPPLIVGMLLVSLLCGAVGSLVSVRSA